MTDHVQLLKLVYLCKGLYWPLHIIVLMFRYYYVVVHLRQECESSQLARVSVFLRHLEKITVCSVA